LDAELFDGQWMILAAGDGVGVCPDCGKQSERRHKARPLPSSFASSDGNAATKLASAKPSQRSFQR
jgi:hypothetical protein